MPQQETRAARLWPALVAVGALALVLRLIYLAEIRAAPFIDLRMGDGLVYHEWARRLADGDWLGGDVFYQAPLYPYLLALIYRIVGDGLTSVRVVQALMGSLSCVLLAHAGASLFGRRGALAAGIGLAVYPPAIFLDSLIQKSAPATLLVAGLLALLGAQTVRVSARRWAAAGVVLGLLALTRENALVFVVLTLFWVLLGRPGDSPRRRVGWAGCFLAGLAVVLLPVGLRNLAVAGEFHLTTAQLGPNLYIGNNPAADGSYRPLSFGRGDARRERDDATAIAERESGRALGPAEVSRFWSSRAFDFMRSQPADWGRLLLRKAALTVNAKEMVDTEAQEVYADWSILLRALGFLHFGVLFPAAVYGGVILAGSWRRLGFLYLLSVGYAASVTAFYVFARYRFPLVPFLVLLAAGGLVSTLDRLRDRGYRSIGVAASVALGAAIVANLPLYSPRHSRAVHYFNIGSKLHEDPDRRAKAIDYFERSLAMAPDYPEAMFGLASALASSGVLEQAAARYRDVVDRRPDYSEARYGLGRVLASLGRHEQALAEYDAVLRARPEFAEAHVASGVALSELGRPGEALSRHRRALEIEPGHVEARVGIGVAWARLGRLDEAVASFESVLEAAPDHAVAHNNLGSVYAMQGRIVAAATQFEHAVRIHPDYADARRNLDQARRILAESASPRN